ncbi:MAG: hypothetical protein KatS3mg027_0451 [Bacteroidia bacterium]|nr:MAG: hypothetical protein KatS3mg027_0451 [Bacteroidia bacterium]
MKKEYEQIENLTKSYTGYSLEKQEITTLFQTDVKSKLLDTSQRKELLNHLNTLLQDTGFEKSETLLVDIQTLQNKRVDVQDFRIGEALAEVVLENNFKCRFYWNELRDARNPKGNKTGADLVGFIEINDTVLFLFGEVKTSSEQASPPQVMTNPDGMEKQLLNLYQDQNKRLFLISYIQNKLNLNNNTNFKSDFEAAKNQYYTNNVCNYILYGILVRDTKADENDLKSSYEKLNNEVLENAGLNLLALYVPIPKNEWLKIINEEGNEIN